MPKSTYFIQGCPTCGRRLMIRVEYLGRHVVCPHCQGQLVASDPSNPTCGNSPSCGDALLRRADELLETVAMRRAQAHDALS
ncbi:MAG: hypothetical protein ACOY3P_12700 [Planctomycetota bacterium]